MRDMEHAVSTSEALRELGVKIFEDDFGVDYSSLGYINDARFY